MKREERAFTQHYRLTLYFREEFAAFGQHVGQSVAFRFGLGPHPLSDDVTLVLIADFCPTTCRSHFNRATDSK